MYNSINHPWSIGDKQRQKYGDTWADMDFVFHTKIMTDTFKEDPMNTTVGQLNLFNQHIDLRYKDLLNIPKILQEQYNETRMMRMAQDYQIAITIRNAQFTLTQHELRKLIETLNEAAISTMRGYELGLYL